MNTLESITAGSGGGVQPIPSATRKIVQSLKEIVNCSEAEIYTVLKDCNMDLNEAVNRLICQDHFHEVKSKREKKKEGKDISDTGARCTSNTSNRDNKSSSDRFLGRGGSTPNYSFESSPLQGKSSFRKDNESAPNTSLLSSAHPVVGKNGSKGPLGLSFGASAENEVTLAAEGVPSDVQSSSGDQSAWVGVPGQVSMAEIVKMGRPPNKASNAANASHYGVQVPALAESHQTIQLSEDLPSKTHEKKAIPVLLGYPVDSELHQGAPCVILGSISQQLDVAEVQEAENGASVGSPGSDDVGSLYISDSNSQEGDLRGPSVVENDYHEKMSSCQSQGHNSEPLDVEEGGHSVAFVTRNFQQLSVGTVDRGFPLEGDVPSVVIPYHLQVHSADLSHLSFGSFGSGTSTADSSVTMKSVPVKTNSGEAIIESDVSSLGHPGARNLEYFANGFLRNASDGGFLIRSDLHGQSFNVSSASQPEELNHENAEVAQGLQLTFPASKPGHTFVDSQHLNDTYRKTSSQMEIISPFSNAMHSYTSSLSSTLLAANVSPTRESDIQYSPFSPMKPTSSRYGTPASSIGGSMAEVLKTADFSSIMLGHQNLSGTSIAAGPPPPQNLAIHHYSQPTLPLGQYDNMIGYPILPQSYTYVPSAFQQTFLGNSTYNQSSATVSSFPQSAAITPGYGSFGSTTIPGNFIVNPPVALSGSTLSYDNRLNSQFKKSNKLTSLQQSENLPMWLHGADSRTMSSVPANTYYNYQAQNQPPAGLRQGQQPSQKYGYPNIYHSHTGMTLDLKNSSVSQGQPKQSQMWQNNY